MKRPDASERLRHMLDHAREAQHLVAHKTRQDLDSDRKLNLAVVRLLEIVGEAAGRVPTEIQQEIAEVPWSDIVGLRHRLIHGYYAVDLEVVWQILERDLPPLVAALEARLVGK
jgi:uncharacterized protein with HEPN domain